MEIAPPSVLLRALEGIRGAPHGYYLAGGTALSLFYLHHRISFDLDLFCPAGSFEGLERIRSAWEREGIRVVPEFEEEIPRMLRVRLLYGAGEAKADFVEDTIPLASKPEDFQGIPVMGIDDIYLRKILIGAEQGVRGRFHRVAARDVLDLYSLHLHHHPLSKRLLGFRGEITVRAIRGLHAWLRKFGLDEISASIRETQYRHGSDSAEILEVLRDEIEEVLAVRLNEIRARK